MSTTADTIRKMSLDAAAAKLAQEQERLEMSVEGDIEIIEKILKMVKDRLIYKEIRPEHSRNIKYEVVTESIVLHDYANKPQYGSGTKIERLAGNYYSYPHTRITVNGHVYYHASDLITKYKFDAEEYVRKAKIELNAARDRKSYIESLDALEPVIKEMMLNYQKHLGNIKAQEE